MFNFQIRLMHVKYSILKERKKKIKDKDRQARELKYDLLTFDDFTPKASQFQKKNQLIFFEDNQKNEERVN